MSTTSIQVNASFMVSVGDNFYRTTVPSEDHSGVVNQTDPSWFNKYYNVYTGKGNQIPWYLVLGNHDYGKYTTGQRTVAKAQIDHTKIDTRWNMPDHNFTKVVEVPGSGGKHMEFVFIDTPRLSPSETSGTDTDYGVSAALQAAMTASHLAWIEQTLAASTATWLIVVGHYQSNISIKYATCIAQFNILISYDTVFGQAPGAGPDDAVLIELLHPLLLQYNVTGYFHGHKHILAVSQEYYRHYFEFKLHHYCYL